MPNNTEMDRLAANGVLLWCISILFFLLRFLCSSTRRVLFFSSVFTQYTCSIYFLRWSESNYSSEHTIFFSHCYSAWHVVHLAFSIHVHTLTWILAQKSADSTDRKLIANLMVPNSLSLSPFFLLWTHCHSWWIRTNVSPRAKDAHKRKERTQIMSSCYFLYISIFICMCVSTPFQKSIESTHRRERSKRSVTLAKCKMKMLQMQFEMTFIGQNENLILHFNKIKNFRSHWNQSLAWIHVEIKKTSAIKKTEAKKKSERGNYKMLLAFPLSRCLDNSWGVHCLLEHANRFGRNQSYAVFENERWLSLMTRGNDAHNKTTHHTHTHSHWLHHPLSHIHTLSTKMRQNLT